MKSKQSKIPKGLYLISGIFIIISLIGGYFEQISVGFIVFIIIFIFFWRDGTPPVIIAALSFQWLSIILAYIYISITDAEMTDLLWRPQYSLENIDKTYWLSLFGLSFFALGLKLAIYNIKERKISYKILLNYDTTKVIIFYSLFTVLSGILFKLVRYAMPGLAQPVNMLSYFKWVLLFIMLYVSLNKKEKQTVVAIILGIEVLMGFTGFFSEFKEILILPKSVFINSSCIDKPGISSTTCLL